MGEEGTQGETEEEREKERESAKEKQQSWQMKLLRQGKSWRRNIIRNSWAVFQMAQRGFVPSKSWGMEQGPRGRGHWSSDYANCMATGNYDWQEALPRAKVRGKTIPTASYKVRAAPGGTAGMGASSHS